MYTAFYGLREKPFALSPDPRFLYLAASHREALAHLLYGIEQGEGFISVTGEVGTGKTTLCRTLLERLEGDIELAFLFNPSRSALELLQSICAEFGLPAEGLGRRNLMSQLNKFLLEQRERGRRVLLIIDEAQTLSENTLEQVRLLSNLETSRDKLIQILLLGQPELDRKLDERGLRQLRQRISVRWKLEPLGDAETLAYVRHRIAVAAGQPKDLFSESALREVHRRTGGIPRLVNQLCDRALLAGYAARATQIGPALIRAAAREIPDVRDPADRDLRLAGRKLLPTWMKRPWMYFAMTLALVGLALVAGLVAGRSGIGASPDARAGQGGSETPTPAVSARGASANAQSAPPLLGRLIGYVPGEAQGELRATDGQLAAAGVGLSGAPGTAALPVIAAPAIGRSAVAPGLFPQLLAERPREAALAESERAFLDLYDLPSDALGPAPTSTDELRERLEARGLMTTAFDGGSFEMLRRLDHPVLIPVAVSDSTSVESASSATPNTTPNPPDAASTPPTASARSTPEADRRWLAVTGFDGDRAWLAGLVAGRVVSVALAELEPRWLEAGVLVWKNHESLADRLDRGGEREGVEWLQDALAELGDFEGTPDGVFDATTADALRAFQSRIGLSEDGVVGPLTQIALYAQLDRYPVPRLSESAVRPPPTPFDAATASDAATSTDPSADRPDYRLSARRSKHGPRRLAPTDSPRRPRMSTILKALRRLENDDPKKKRTGAPPVLRDAPTAAPLPPTDPRAADALRGRILAEEAAARVVSNLRDEAEPGTSRVRPLLVRTLAAVAVLAALLFGLTKAGLFTDSAPNTESPVATAEPMPPVAPAPVASASAQPSTPSAPPRAMVAVPNPLESANPAIAAPPPAPTSVATSAAPIAAPIAAAPPSSAVASPAQNVEVARVAPTAPAPRAGPPPPPPTVAAQPAPSPPTRAAVPVPVPAATPEPIIEAVPQAASQTAPEVTPKTAPVSVPVARPTPTDVAAHRPADGVRSNSALSSPAPSARALEPVPVPSADVKRVAPAGLPEITVVRTAWHPKPERRSAKVRIVETDELVTVREGDAIEGLVLQEITPSAVVFSAGDVEIRRRVGEASASR